MTGLRTAETIGRRVSVDHPNAERLRDFFAAVKERDIQRVAGSISPEAVYHVPGQSVIAGEHAGLDGIGGLMGTLMQESGCQRGRPSLCLFEGKGNGKLQGRMEQTS